MSNEPKTLRRSFATQKPVVELARNETVAVKSRPLADAYFNGEVTKFGGKVLSSGSCEATQPLNKFVIHALKLGEFDPLAKGSSENVRVDNYVIKDLPPYRPNNIASILKDKGSRE